MVKIFILLQAPSVRIILFLHQHGEVRYSELTRLLTSRGTLSLNLKELEEEGLIQRRIIDSKPIQSYYSLTNKGREIAKLFNEISSFV